MRKIVPICLFVLSATGCATRAPSAVPADAPVADASPVLTIPLEPYGTAGLRQVRVVVAGDTLNFLFDTGGGMTVLTPDLASRIDCTLTGRAGGYRMTGQRLDADVCRNVALDVGGLNVVQDAAVLDLMAVLGPNAPLVHGMISLHSLAGRSLTLDLAGNRLIIESERSLAERTRAMTPVPARIATGPSGGGAVLFAGFDIGPRRVWLELDSGHQGTTFISPWAASALGESDSVGAVAEVELALAPGQVVTLPIEVKDVIHDGVLNAAFMTRATWTMDLAAPRLWVHDVQPLLSAPPRVERPAPPSVELNGWYDVTLIVNGGRQPAILEVAPGPAGSIGRMRFVGTDLVFDVGPVEFEGGELRFDLTMRAVYPIRIRFDGIRGEGTWGDPAARGGVVEATKRS